MIKALVSDFSKVLLFRKDDPEKGKLNDYYQSVKDEENFNFWNYFQLKDELLKIYESLRIDLYIFTSEYIQDDPAVKEKLSAIFTSILSAAEMGVKKETPEAYIILADNLKLNRGEILFIDDNEDNIKAAIAVGLSTIHYKNNDQLEMTAKELLNEE